MKETEREGKEVVGSSWTPVLALGLPKTVPHQGAHSSQDRGPPAGLGFHPAVRVCEEPGAGHIAGASWDPLVATPTPCGLGASPG